jgi:phage gp46-like protein
MTWEISWRGHEADEPATPLDWDTVLDLDAGELAFDWRLAPLDGEIDSGGLRARAAIATAVIISLFTDARAPDGWRPEVIDRRGWWGDGLNADGEEPLGSWLWTVLENGVATAATARDAEAEAARALAWMTRDGVAGSVEAAATVLPADRRLTLAIIIRSPSGAELFARDFDLLWRQVR